MMFSPRKRARCQQLFEKYYAGREFHDVLYRKLIRKYLAPGERLLDAGCGRYLAVCREFSGVAQVFGIDLEEKLDTDNRTAPFGIRGDAARLPFSSESFDMVISRSVIEHLADPVQAFREFARVLRPGGRVVIVTPNKWDYVSLIAAVTPYKLHRWLISRIIAVSADDVFPTLYRANTICAIRRGLKSAGLNEREIDTINHYPAYLMFSPLLFRAGVLYERLTSLRPFRSLRGSILCVFEKSASSDGRNPKEQRHADTQRAPAGVP